MGNYKLTSLIASLQVRCREQCGLLVSRIGTDVLTELVKDLETLLVSRVCSQNDSSSSSLTSSVSTSVPIRLTNALIRWSEKKLMHELVARQNDSSSSTIEFQSPLASVNVTSSEAEAYIGGQSILHPFLFG
jgi:hypothetical protein